MASSSSTPSNEQIVDEITKEFSENLKVNKDSNTNLQDNSQIPEDFDHSDSEEPTGIVEDDFVDEENLKDVEISLSDEEKEVRHKEALELKKEGNEAFKQGNYLESIEFYTKGLRICPLKFVEDRSVLYANRGASKAKLSRKPQAIEDCTRSIEINSSYLKAYLRRANLYEETEKLDESLADFKKVLELDGGNKDALAAQVRLPPMIEEKNQKLKDEMISKLKDLGNVILKPFGLSTNNFNLVQDPNTGGYSVNFQQGGS